MNRLGDVFGVGGDRLGVGREAPGGLREEVKGPRASGCGGSMRLAVPLVEGEPVSGVGTLLLTTPIIWWPLEFRRPLIVA
jgi:hypothetical protein